MFNQETHDAAIEAVEAFYPPETPLETVLATRDMMSLAIKRYCEIQTRVESPAKEIAALRDALTPSAKTKAALMGEFSVPLPDYDEDGNEVMRQINVPWVTIKKIMLAIQALAKDETDAE